MNKKKVLFAVGIYLTIVALAVIGIISINKTLARRVPPIYNDLGQQGTESFESGKYNISLHSYDYFKESGTVYMVWEVTSDDKKKPDTSTDDTEIVPGVGVKLTEEGKVMVTKKIYRDKTLVLCMFAQLNDIASYDDVGFSVSNNGEVIEEFTLGKSEYKGERITADTKCMGTLDFTSMGIVITYKNKAPDIDKIAFKRKFNSDYLITDNEVIDTIYDTGKELVIVLRKELDFNGVESLVANDEEAAITMQAEK